MNMPTILAVAFFAAASISLSAADNTVERIYRPNIVTRGNINLIPVQPIDSASWIHHELAYSKDISFVQFRKRFTVGDNGADFEIDVSADERFYLMLDGKFVARGPNRGTVDNWQYQSYRLKLDKGEHVFSAVVWSTTKAAPLAQLTNGGGFILKASGEYDEKLTTGKTDWEVGVLTNPKSLGNGQCWGTGSQFEITGTGMYDEIPKKWEKAIVVRGEAGYKDKTVPYRNWGLKTLGWMLFPAQLPDQSEYHIRPGSVRAVSEGDVSTNAHVYVESETRGALLNSFNALIKQSEPLMIPANSRVRAAWNLDNYYCAYPVLTVKGGKGARIKFGWAESTRDASTFRKANRDAIAGMFLRTFGDVFVSDGRERAVFSTPWFRCGKWCEIDIETQDEPIVLEDVLLIESRYPLELQCKFECEDLTLDPIRTICARAMQMCSHEMLFDCPYYEQQMYPGDTRVQLNVLSAMSHDDRIIKRAIELYSLAVRDDGMCPFNWPTRGVQEGASYTLCYLCMYGDYVMYHADKAWLKARIPSMRMSMAGIEQYENEEGLLENLPGWNFMDWVDGWASDGTAEGCRYGSGVNAEINLFWLKAMISASKVERAFGNDLQGEYWDRKADKLRAKIIEKFWCEKRGILADTPKMQNFSEHAQCLALLTETIPAEKAHSVFKHLIEDQDLKRTTVYFSYYLFECYFKFGRGDLFLKRLDLWRGYLAKGLDTTQEAPDKGKNGQFESRSDCHAWGSHPIWFMQTGLAGIRSAAPFFSKVRIAPHPGSLKKIVASYPHPSGEWIKVDLKFDGDKVAGTVTTPVEGEFVFAGKTVLLIDGVNEL